MTDKTILRLIENTQRNPTHRGLPQINGLPPNRLYMHPCSNTHAAPNPTMHGPSSWLHLRQISSSPDACTFSYHTSCWWYKICVTSWMIPYLVLWPNQLWRLLHFHLDSWSISELHNIHQFVRSLDHYAVGIPKKTKLNQWGTNFSESWSWLEVRCWGKFQTSRVTSSDGGSRLNNPLWGW